MATQDDMSLGDERQVDRLDLRRLARDVLGKRQDSEDVVQDAWLSYLREPPGRVRSLAAWFRVAILHVAVRSRLRDRQRLLREKRVARANLTPSVVEQIERKVEQEFLAAIVHELGEPYREIVCLRYLEGLEIEEIAARFRRSPGTIRSQLKRGLDLLRVRFGQESRRRKFFVLFPWPWRRTAARSEGLAVQLAGARRLLVWEVAACLLAVSGLAFVARRAERAVPDGATRPEDGARHALAELALPASGRAALAPGAHDDAAPAEQVRPEADWSIGVSGTVLAPDGAPVPGAAILMGSEDGSDARVAARSDELGLYRIERADPRLLIWAEERERASSQRLFLGSNRVGHELDLRLGHPVGTVAGRVFSFQGQPVPRAEVRLIASARMFYANDDAVLWLPPPTSRVWTALDGTFRLGLSASEKAHLLVIAEGHPPLLSPIRGARQGVVLTLPEPCVLEGRFLRPDGTPASGARLELVFPDPLPRCDTTTDEAGTFRFDAMPPGPHALRLLSDLETASCFVEGELRVGERAWRTVRLTEENTLRGRALDGDSPLAGWSVELEDLDLGGRKGDGLPRDLRRTRTREDGSFEFLSCSLAYPYMVRLFEPGDTRGLPRAVAREVHAGREQILLRPSNSRPGSLVGRFECLDPSIRPVIAALRGDSFSRPLLVRVDPVTGDFSADGLPPGRYPLRAWAPPFGIWHAGLIEIHPERRTELFIPVPEPGSLRVQLDLPEPGDWDDLDARITTPAFHDSDSEAHTRELRKCPQQGVLLADLFPGEYTCNLRLRGMLLVTRRVSIDSGRTTMVNVPRPVHGDIARPDEHGARRKTGRDGSGQSSGG